MSKTLKSGNPEGNDGQTGRHQQETRWEEVANTAGITQAQIIAGRLQSEGIPARAWQESVGQTTGLVVGSLGMGHVLVPEEFVARALEILDDVEEFDAEDDQDEWLAD